MSDNEKPIVELLENINHTVSCVEDNFIALTNACRIAEEQANLFRRRLKEMNKKMFTN